MSLAIDPKTGKPIPMPPGFDTPTAPPGYGIPSQPSIQPVGPGIMPVGPPVQQKPMPPGPGIMPVGPGVPMKPQMPSGPSIMPVGQPQIGGPLPGNPGPIQTMGAGAPPMPPQIQPFPQPPPRPMPPQAQNPYGRPMGQLGQGIQNQVQQYLGRPNPYMPRLQQGLQNVSNRMQARR